MTIGVNWYTVGPMRRYLVLVLFWLAFGVRLYALTDYPPGLSGDEGINASDALRIDATYHPLFFEQNFGREPLYIYTAAALFRAAGASAFVLRYTTVLYSLLALACCFLLIRKWYGVPTALIACGFIGLSFWPLSLSRVGLRAVTLLPWQTLTVYGLWRGLETRRWRYFVGAGAALGLMMYTYIPARIFPLVLIMWLLVYRWWDVRQQWGRLLGLTGLALVLVVPFLWLNWQQPTAVNQRLAAVGQPIEALRAGDWRPAWQGVGLTARMFTFRGDPYVRYNVPERPLFSWGVGLFFYGGVLWVLWHWRRPREGLLLLWLALMLLPTALSDRIPSFLRAVGSLVPIFTLLAVGLWQVVQRVFKGERGRWVLVGGVLMVEAFLSAHAYFQVWARLPEVGEVYGGRVGQLAAAADALDTESPILVSCYYALHICEDMIVLQSDYGRDQVRGFAGYEGVVLPADGLLLFGHGLPLSPLLEAQMGQQVWGDGVEMAVYRLPPTVLLPNSLQGQFQNGEAALNLVGYEMATQGEAGTAAEMALFWQVPEELVWPGGETPVWQVTLTDDEGRVWSTAEGHFPLSAAAWQGGDRLGTTAVLPLPVDTPPISLQAQVGLWQAEAGSYQYVADTVQPQAALAMLTIQAATGQPPPADPLLVMDDVWLTEANWPPTHDLAQPLLTEWQWYVAQQLPQSYHLQFLLQAEGCQGETVWQGEADLGTDTYPSAQWREQSLVRTFAPVSFPLQIQGGAYGLAVRLVGEGERPLLCRPLLLEGHVPQFTIPDMENELQVPFSDGIILLGYSTEQTADQLRVTVFWQAAATPGQVYKSFVHLYDETGALVSQVDTFLCCPTNRWQPQEVIAATYELPLATSLTPEFRLGFGWYDPDSFERLPIPNTPDNVFLVPYAPPD